MVRELRFSSQVYALDVVKKAAYRFTDRCAFDFVAEGDDVLCRLTPLVDQGPDALNELENAFRNEILDQDLRRIIADETASIRNAVLAYAFSRTGLQDSE